ncbi:MAG TPA: hypothetical protein DEG28_01475 [Porphyromonadaceae bacterium]|nr:hypothetical protein [Porphyromonadaceae bacterium]
MMILPNFFRAQRNEIDVTKRLKFYEVFVTNSSDKHFAKERHKTTLEKRKISFENTKMAFEKMKMTKEN